MTASLLETKLRCPSLPAKRVHRPHLNQRLNEEIAIGQPVTLVSAPAGFGKTFCVGDWLTDLEMPVTWLSLDSADDDPGRFFSYFIAALRKADENIGQEIVGILRSGQLPPSEIISTTLVNDILDLEGSFVLVLDDFQVPNVQLIRRPPNHLNAMVAALVAG
jgi:LuxR family maltose regulon positive regulatory protein